MSTTPAPDDHDELTVSATTWGLLRRAAFAGRLALLPAAFVTLLAAWINRPLEGGFAGVVVTLAALALAGLAWLSLQDARRGLDAGAAALALVLAGGEALQAFGLVGTGVGAFGGKEFYVLPLLAWLLLLGGGLPLFASLVPGPVATNIRAVPNPFAGRTAPAAAAPEAPRSRFAPAASPADPATTSRFAPAAPATASAAPAGRPAAEAPAPAAGHPAAAPSTAASPEQPSSASPETASTAVTPPDADSGPGDAAATGGTPTDDTDVTVVADAPATDAPPADLAPAQASPEPGWYPSSDGRTARWWDGDAWTGDRRPLSDFEDR